MAAAPLEPLLPPSWNTSPHPTPPPVLFIPTSYAARRKALISYRFNSTPHRMRPSLLDSIRAENSLTRHWDRCSSRRSNTPPGQRLRHSVTLTRSPSTRSNRQDITPLGKENRSRRPRMTTGTTSTTQMRRRRPRPKADNIQSRSSAPAQQTQQRTPPGRYRQPGKGRRLSATPG